MKNKLLIWWMDLWYWRALEPKVEPPRKFGWRVRGQFVSAESLGIEVE